MRILLVTTWDTECGIATYSAALAEALRGRGCEVVIAAEHTRASMKGASSGSDGVYRVWDRQSPYTAPHGLSWVGELARKLDPDVVHFQHEFGLFPRPDDLFHCVEALKTPSFITLHTVVAPPERQSFFRPKVMPPVIVHTDAGALVCAAWGIPATVIPHGSTVHLPRVSSSQRSQRFLRQRFLCPGFMGRSKGQLEILKAFVDVNARLDMIGACRDEAYLGELRNTAARYGLEGRVNLQARFATDIELQHAFAEAFCVILGGGKDSPYSASGQLHHALGHGVPVLAKNTPIYRSATAGVLYYSSPEELTALVHGMINSPALATKIGEEGYQQAQSRSWPNVARMHEEVYRRVG